MRTHLLPLVLLALLPGAQNPQEPPKPRPQPDVQVTPSPGAKKEIARITKEMQGLWALKELDWPHIRGQSAESRGYCLVGGNHLALEIHIGLRGPDQSIKDVMLDSGTWRFDVVEGGRVLLQALIGSFIDKDNRVAFREPGTRHRYGVEAGGDRLVLTHEDGQRIIFTRVADSGPVQRDAFGRPLKEKPADEPQDGGAKDSPPRRKED